MADNLIQKSHKTSEKNKFNNVVHRTTSESLRLNESEKGVSHPTSLQATHNPRKISSFQITSVTVGSRVSTDAGEDSADDLDESHTDDISRVTDIENETPSYSEDTFSKDDVFYNASSASLGCAPVIPTSSQYGLAIVGQDNNATQVGGAVPNSNNSEVSDMHVSVTNAGTGSIINLIGNAKPQEGMKEIQEHVRNERFKVVKIESTEPFRRGRWMCMDYLDHTSAQQNAPINLNNNLDVPDTNILQAPDSSVVINDCQHDDLSNDLTNKGPKDVQGNPPIVQQLEQAVQKQFPMVSPGQSLTQPINVVQQPLTVSQSVSVQSPPMEMPQQMPNQNMQPSQQVGQQHPQSMTHITMQNAPQNHSQPAQPQQVQQIPQSFPQHQLQQVIAQSQGIAMQQIPMHQQMSQQMQQIPNQQMQQLSQHMPQAQIPNMQQIQQQMPQMQGIPNQAQMPVTNQQSQMQQMQIQQMQTQANSQQLHPMQQAQMPNMSHLQGQQAMSAQQAQLQHLPSQAQIQALQSQQIPNHIQQMQMPSQLPNQQLTQMQTQMHQMPSQPQQQVVPSMHAQIQQQGMTGVQQQYNQAVNQQPTQSMIGASMPSSQQQMVQPQHNVPQYHTQQSQMSQQGQTLPQEVLTSIVSSQQGATLPSNLQPMASQSQGSTLPANIQSLAQQQPPPVHMNQQANVQQGNMQMMATGQQNIQMTMDGNQAAMQKPGAEAMYIQATNVGQQMPVGQHMGQAQNMLPQQVTGGQGQIQYVSNQQVPQVSMTHQNIPMSMQQPMPVGMSGAVHPSVVQSQTSMGLGFGVVSVMSQNSVAPVESTVSGTNSPVVSMPVSSATYVANTGQAVPDGQNFGSPVNAVVSHPISGAVMSNVNVSVCDSVQETGVDTVQVGDFGDAKEDLQAAQPTEDESINGLALALGGGGTGSPAAAAGDSRAHTATSSRAPSPPPADRQQHSSISDSDDDAEWVESRRIMMNAISPLSPVRNPLGCSPARDRSPAPEFEPARDPSPAFRVEVLQSASRGGVSSRGRGRGRGSGRGRVSVRGERGWMRGQPLEERFVQDAELPEQLREDIRRILAGRVNARRRMNVEQERVVDDGDELRVDDDFDANEGFVWRPMNEWNGAKENFIPETTGPSRQFDNAYDALHSFWTDDVMSHIAVESNRYADSLSATRPRFARNWYNTNADEIWTMFAFWIMLGIIRMPSIKSCFTKIPILKTDVFRRLFAEYRYWDLNAAFHLVEGTDRDNPLHPMGPIIDHLNSKFQEMYRLDQDICIDESLTLWKGPVRFKQYIKTKSARFGIKTFQLCESATGYLWSFFVYVGRGSDASSIPSSVQTVLRLVRPLLHLGHTLYMDNWFNSPMLARWLKRRKTDCVGTLRASRKHVPLEVQRCPLAEGQFIARASENVMVVAVHDRKRVACLSTYHDVSQVRKEARPGHPGQYKLQLIDDYNQSMGGVDRLDQMLEPYLVERKQCLKWNKKLFKRLLNFSIQNARILVEKSTNKKIDSLAFRLAVFNEIISRHLPNVPQRRQAVRPQTEVRLTERHFLRRIPITDEMRQAVVHRSNLGRRNCAWCTRNGRRNSKSVYECTECDVPLCLEPCFREYHTLP